MPKTVAGAAGLDAGADADDEADSEAIIRTSGLTKTYPKADHPAVDRLDLRVRRGELFGLLGPNGAGKTTTVEILEGFRTRDSGSVEVFGFDPGKGERAYRERIGVVLQDTTVDRFLTVAETVELLGQGLPVTASDQRDAGACGPLRAAQHARWKAVRWTASPP